MTERPRWTNEVRLFLSDTVIDEEYNYPMDGSDDDLLDRIEAAVNAVLCAEYGHDIENDQCGKPEHRYCVHCHLRESAILSTGSEP